MIRHLDSSCAGPMAAGKMTGAPALGNCRRRGIAFAGPFLPVRAACRLRQSAEHGTRLTTQLLAGTGANRLKGSMPTTSEGATAHRSIVLTDEAATAALGAALAHRVRPGDVLTLAGPLGVGKTSFARAFIAALGVRDEVPSPTFTLVQTYETAIGTVWHFDLYRLTGPDEVHELGLDEALVDGIVLIEWPERLGALLPRERLDVALEPGIGASTRLATLHGTRRWVSALGEISADG
jgi:tRNA threonylcarbamoyladenosine biosynthesis protein TsaE